MEYISQFDVQINSSHNNIDNLDLLALSLLQQQFNNVRKKETELKNKIIESRKAIGMISTTSANKINNILQSFTTLHIDYKKKIIETMSNNEMTNNDKIKNILTEVDIYENDFEGGSYNNIDITNTLQDIF